MPNHIFINPPFEQCHGSTLALLSDGSVAVSWFAGTKEGNPDTSIWFCRQTNGEWDKPFVIAKEGNMAHWNPVLHSMEDGTLRLYFKTGLFPDSWDTWQMTIDEHGKVLSSPQLLMPITLNDIGKITLGPVRGKMLKTSSGALIAPSSVEKILNKDVVGFYVQRDVLWNSVMHRSTDNGETWSTFIIPYSRMTNEDGGIIQPSVWEIKPNHLGAFFRSTTGYLFRSESYDDGITWNPATETSIPNPNSAVDVVRLGDVLVLVYNPRSGNWVRRTPLSVVFASLDGHCFSNPVNIDDYILGNYSYPSVITLSDNMLAVTYTWNRRFINFAKIKNDNGKPVIEFCPKPYQFND